MLHEDAMRLHMNTQQESESVVLVTTRSLLDSEFVPDRYREGTCTMSLPGS